MNWPILKFSYLYTYSLYPIQYLKQVTEILIKIFITVLNWINTMKYTAIGALLTLFALSTTATAESNITKGENLFNKANCQSCHSPEVFTQADRKVKNIAELESKVRFCDSQLSANWFDDEITDVVAYLNNAFYKFEIEDNNKD